MQEEYICNSLLGLSNDNLGLLFEYIEDGIVIIEQDGTISYANGSFVKYFKYKREDLVGAFLMNLIPDAYQDQFRKMFKEFHFSDKNYDHIDYIHNYSDGNFKWFSLNISALRIHSGRDYNIKLLGILKEIEKSTGNSSNEALENKFWTNKSINTKELEQLYYKFYSNYDFGIFIKHLSKKEIYLNDSFVKIFNFKDSETAKSKFNLFDYILNDENYNTFLNELNFNGGVCFNRSITFHKEAAGDFNATLFIDFVRNQKGVPVYIQTVIIPNKANIEASVDLKFEINKLLNINESILIMNEIKSEQFIPYFINILKKNKFKSAFVWLLSSDRKKIIDYADSLGNNIASQIFSDSFYRRLESRGKSSPLCSDLVLDPSDFLEPKYNDIFHNQTFSIFKSESSSDLNFYIGAFYDSKDIPSINMLKENASILMRIFELLMLKSYQKSETDQIYSTQRISNILRNELEVLAVSEISQLLTEIIDYELIFQKSLEKISELFGFEFGWVYLINNQENKLTISSCYNLPDNLKEFIIRDPKISQPMKDFLKSRDILFSSNSDVLKSWFTLSEPDMEKIDNFHSILLLPLKAKGALNGVMIFVAKTEISINEWDKKILDSLSIIIGSSYENSILYSETLNKTVELEKRNKELNDFTHIVSHDLKNPINNIMGISKILKNEFYTSFSADVNEFVQIIFESANRSQKLITDLLHLSRIGRVGEIMKNVDLNELLQNILFDISVLMKERNVKVIIDSVLPVIDCDPVRIAEVFQNLISNGIKYNDKNEIIINIGSIEKRDYYEIYIKDNGIGITRDHYDDVFQIFRRIGESKEEGTGIGLAIVKKIIDFHQGRITLESEKGNYTKFIFTLPKKVIISKLENE